ncbi:MAG: SUF system NifU family Fe-S cluster assembly protein [Actinomycetaceae bacterium]|nr:SUF system NifU family Fe-S cluster assembly protein [Actinomycetaceae bacterium]
MNELEQLYQAIILQHSKERHGFGELQGGLASSHQVNPTCGDEVTLELSLDGENLGPLVWKGSGCSISQASLSVMYDLVEGKKLAEIRSLFTDFKTLMHSRGQEVDEDILDRLEDASAFQGVSRYVARIKCALLGWMALDDALLQAESQRGKVQAHQEAEHCITVSPVED